MGTANHQWAPQITNGHRKLHISSRRGPACPNHSGVEGVEGFEGVEGVEVEVSRPSTRRGVEGVEGVDVEVSRCRGHISVFWGSLFFFKKNIAMNMSSQRKT